MKTVLILSFMFALTAQAAELKYFLAQNVTIDVTDTKDPNNTWLQMGYDVPCWADAIESVKSAEFIETPELPSRDFKIAVGVLLKENNETHMCNMVYPPVRREHRHFVVNTRSIDGNFVGFVVIQGSAPADVVPQPEPVPTP